MKTLYTAEATVSGGRQGHGRTSDGKIDVEMTIPKEMGGPGGEGTNPEQLFAVGYSACFLGAVDLVARNKEKEIGKATVKGHVSIGTGDDGGFELAVELECNLPDVSKEEAEEIVNEAHQVCPYSKATRNNVPVTLKVV